jgi:hypothetical protein
MGLLIYQRKDEGYFVKINEEWAVDTTVDAMEIMKFLMDKSIPFRASYSFELIHIHFEDSVYTNKEYVSFKKVLIELLDYKEMHGDFKDLKELKAMKKTGGKNNGDR